MSSVDSAPSYKVNVNVPKDADFKDYAKLAEKVGKGMASAEKDLFAAFKSGNEAQIQKAMVVYQHWQRLMELVTTIIKSMHDILMSIIRKLTV